MHPQRCCYCNVVWLPLHPSGAAEDDVVFIPNASDAVNAVLRSLQPPVGQKILLLNTAYGMVRLLRLRGGGCRTLSAHTRTHAR